MIFAGNTSPLFISFLIFIHQDTGKTTYILITENVIVTQSHPAAPPR